MIMVNDKGEGFSKYKDIMVNKYKETKDVSQGIFVFVKNIKTNQMWKANYDFKDENKAKYKVIFSADKAKIIKEKDNIETEISIIVSENLSSEIRSIKVKNKSNNEESLEITSIFEPVLSKIEDDIAHPAFNNLFLKYSLSDERRFNSKKEQKRRFKRDLSWMQPICRK